MEHTVISVILGLFVGYLCGSIPFGFLIAKFFKGVDIREQGSGNIGATNAWRTLGPAAGLCVFVLDVLKGWVPTFLAVGAGHPFDQLAAGSGAILGHTFCPFLKFKGGRGVATGLGFCIAMVPMASLGAFVIWVVALVLGRWVSLASCLAAIGLPLLAMTILRAPASTHPGHLLLIWPAAIFVVAKHKANFIRLGNGTEPKVNMPWIKK